MLDNAIIKKIEEFVYSKPRSIQEIAEHIGKSWRTADRYANEIEKNFGTISTRTFRGGTRGALKIAYWASIEKISSSVLQEKLEEDIMKAKKREDFSAFDIFQFVKDKNKKAIIEKAIAEDTTNLNELGELLVKTKNQILIFSGNLSFINLKNNNFDMMKILDDFVKKGIIIKILCRIDLAGRENIEKVLSLNFKHGKQMIEIRHREHPIRAFVIDNEIIRIKEVKEPTGKINELDRKIFIFYTIKDKEWAEWLSRIFWRMFSSSVDANKRIIEMRKIK